MYSLENNFYLNIFIQIIIILINFSNEYEKNHEIFL